MPKATKPKTQTTAELRAELQKHTDHIEWSKRIITMQQQEIDRLMKLTDSLTDAINNISKWSRD
jgi:hypothetical protein